MSESNDAVLQRHRQRFEAHRQWLREQQAAINGEGGERPAMIPPLSARTATSQRTMSGTTPATPTQSIGRQFSSASAMQRQQQQQEGNEAGEFDAEEGQYPRASAGRGGNKDDRGNPNTNNGGSVNAPAYSQQQRSQKTAAAAMWVEEQQQGGTAASSVPNTARSRFSQSQPQQYGGEYDNNAPAAAEEEQYYDDGVGEDAEEDYYNHQHYQQQHGSRHHHHNHHRGDDDERSQISSTQLMLMDGSPLHVYSRATQWQKRKQQKLLEMREEVERRELSACTFKPDRVRVRSSSGATSFHAGNDSYRSSSGCGYGYGARDPAFAAPVSVADVSGWEEFMCRKLRAKQLLDEKKSRLQSDGSKWTGQSTVIEEFNLGQPAAGRRLQKVLKPPVAAPHVGNRAAVGASIIVNNNSIYSGGAASRQGGFSSSSYYSNLGAGRSNASFASASSPPPPRANDVPIADAHQQLPPKGLFSLKGSSTFVEGMASGNGAPNGEVFE